jgi:clan AA aspartic protease
MRNIKRDNVGEVNVRVRLSNAMEAEMAERGLLDADKVHTCEVDALVDTGATQSVISEEVARQLGLTIRRESMAILADGSRVPIGLSSTVSFEIQGRETRQDAYVLGDQVLIGQTVLESTDLLVDCKNHKIIPNPAHPDGPAFRI